MCEIAVFDPSRTDPQTAADATLSMFRHNSDGVGVVSARREGDTWSFDVCKNTTMWVKTDEPSTVAAKDPILKHMWKTADHDLWFVHARLATHGETSHETAHPLDVCPKSGWDMVIHNGVVRNYERLKDRQVEGSVPQLSTAVDSEIIPWYVTDTGSAQEPPKHGNMKGSLNYVVFRDGVAFAHFGPRYQVDDMGRVATCYREEPWPTGDSATHTWVRYGPDTTDVSRVAFPIPSGGSTGYLSMSTWKGFTSGDGPLSGHLSDPTDDSGDRESPDSNATARMSTRDTSDARNGNMCETCGGAVAHPSRDLCSKCLGYDTGVGKW
jgi:predicted glutamine amidotransferase